MMAEIIRLPGRRAGSPLEIRHEIERMHKIAIESADHAILADGPVSPDADLLELCAEALHFLTEAKRTEDDSRTAVRMGWEIRTGCFDRAKPLMKRIRKLKARTAVGIYAKALVVRESVSGAPMLAMSLAEDLIACPGLRASLWTAEAKSMA